MIFIIGCGGFAKEVLFLLEEVKGSLKDFKGFIDYKPKKNRISCRGSEFSVIDEADFLSGNYKKNEIELYIGIGDPKIIKTISEKFNDYKFPNLIHRNVIKDESVFLGQVLCYELLVVYLQMQSLRLLPWQKDNLDLILI